MYVYSTISPFFPSIPSEHSIHSNPISALQKMIGKVIGKAYTFPVSEHNE